MSLKLLSHAEQVAAYLEKEILGGRWQKDMPGVSHLEKELGINQVTINSALRLLEAQGLLVSQGPKRRRQIAPLQKGTRKKPMRIRIMLYDQESGLSHHSIGLLDKLHRAGFNVNYARKSLQELNMNPDKVARFVSKTEADAWVVIAASHEVLSWFAQQEKPCIAVFGRFSGLPIAAASPRAAPAIIHAVQRLAALGHRRIVMLARKERRKPTPALVERLFLEELETLGIRTGAYNLPDWDDNQSGFIACLDTLFQHTPPTALICGEPRLLAAAQQHLARRGILSPEHVSLICSEADLTLAWCHPAIAHIQWDPRLVMRRVVRWANHIASGKTDLGQKLFNGILVEGGTIGPAPKDGYIPPARQRL